MGKFKNVRLYRFFVCFLCRSMFLFEPIFTQQGQFTEYYSLLATAADNVHEARMAARPAHLQRLEALKAEGRLLTAGPNPLPDNPERVSGSLIVAQFESLDAAQEWAEKDPYVDAGVYEEVLIKPFKAVFK